MKKTNLEKINIQIWTQLQYFVLIGLICGQCTVGENFIIGQLIYLGTNVLSVARSFILKRPASDKVKDICCFGITLGLILIRLV